MTLLPQRPGCRLWTVEDVGTPLPHLHLKVYLVNAMALDFHNGVTLGESYKRIPSLLKGTLAPYPGICNRPIAHPVTATPPSYGP